MDSIKLFILITTYKPYWTQRNTFLAEAMERYNKRKQTRKQELAYTFLEEEIFEDYKKWKTKKH